MAEPEKPKAAEQVVEELLRDNFNLEDNTTNHKNEEDIFEDAKLIQDDNHNEEDSDEGEEKTEKNNLKDDGIDEEKLKLEEESLTEEQLEERHAEAKSLKEFGNAQYTNEEFKASILSYTKALLICPLKEKELRSVLYSNRAASKVKLEFKEGAIEDCTRALENNPNYMKPLARRAKLYDDTEKLDEALADYTKIVELDPSNREARIALQRLPSQINERNEKLKTEMMGKLKDLGNMVLRPFGLSTENFQLQQDPNSGSYSVNFKK